jgi:T5SS/PEP-CTERM-associated repeat protein
MRHNSLARAFGLCVVALFLQATSAPSVAFGQDGDELIITTDTTYDGPLVMRPRGEGRVIISSESNPLLTLRGGTSGVKNIQIGNEAWEQGRVLIETTAAAVDGNFSVGFGGIGELEIRNGAKVESERISLGIVQGGEGSATVRGAGSSLKTGLDFNIGVSGVGEFNILEGGSVETMNLRIGGFGGTPGFGEGEGTLTIASGGTLNVSSSSQIRAYGGATAKAIVRGEGTLWSSGGLRVGGNRGEGTLEILEGATVLCRGASVGGDEFESGGVGRVIIEGEGSSWDISSSPLRLGGKGGYGEIEIDHGARVTSAGAKIGDDDGTGVATIRGAGSVWEITNRNSFDIGSDSNGIGELNILDGGELNSATRYITVHQGSAVIIAGNGSMWEGLDSSIENYGSMLLQEGGQLKSKSAYVPGNVAIKGAGTEWQVLNTFSLHDGALTILDGGTVRGNAGAVFQEATALIQGVGSRWIHAGNLYLGYDDPNLGSVGGKLTLADGGTVEVGGAVIIAEHGTVNGDGGTILGDVENAGVISPGNSLGTIEIQGDLLSTGKLVMEVGSAGAADLLIVQDQLTLGGLIEVVLADGAQVKSGDQFRLLEFGSLVDAGYLLDLGGVPLSNPEWRWDTSQLAINGTIRVVPEPASLVLLGIAGLGLLPVVRRRAVAARRLC